MDGLETMNKGQLIAIINDLRYEIESQKSANLAIQRNYDSLNKLMAKKGQNLGSKTQKNSEEIKNLKNRIEELESELQIEKKNKEVPIVFN